MGCRWGNHFRLHIFGESHGESVGLVMDGLPKGLRINMDFVQEEMERRRPGKRALNSARNEKDDFEVLSGFFNGFTTGTPMAVVIPNRDRRSIDYEALRNVVRPGHADYTSWIKYNGFNDFRGGGHFSGRLTAPLVFAGAIAKQILQNENVTIGSHLLQIGSIYDCRFDSVEVSSNQLEALRRQDLPTIVEHISREMEELIALVKEQDDSIGGVIECVAIGLPAGLGEPFFDSVESMLSHLAFSIPAVKAIEFGDGFSLAEMRGSISNDVFTIENGSVITETNHAGGVLGGISNGMPLIFRVAIKPTPSIGKKQRTINIKEMKPCQIQITGRHDPCIVPRALPVVEAVCAIALVELLWANGASVVPIC